MAKRGPKKSLTEQQRILNKTSKKSIHIHTALHDRLQQLSFDYKIPMTHFIDIILNHGLKALEDKLCESPSARFNEIMKGEADEFNIQDDQKNDGTEQ